jgi:PPOX class probable F420-dependent enzyme
VSAAGDAITDNVRDWLTRRHHAVLITLRKDGSPQSSNVSFTFDGSVARISVTTDRAKTRNVQRDPRVVLHVLGDTFWEYAAVQATATPSEPTVEAGDAVGRELLDVYESITGGKHPDPDEFLRDMVTQHRLVLTVRPVRASANIG